MNCFLEETKHHNDDKGLQFYNTEFKDEVSFYGRDWNMNSCIKNSTLMGWRVRREGPTYTKIGSKVFYKLKDIEEYEATHQIKHRNWH